MFLLFPGPTLHWEELLKHKFVRRKACLVIASSELLQTEAWKWKWNWSKVYCRSCIRVGCLFVFHFQAPLLSNWMDYQQFQKRSQQKKYGKFPFSLYLKVVFHLLLLWIHVVMYILSLFHFHFFASFGESRLDIALILLHDVGYSLALSPFKNWMYWMYIVWWYNCLMFEL